MWTHLRRIIPRNVKRQLIALDRAIDRRTLSQDAFIDLISRAGFKPGAVVMVHSSMDEVSRRLPHLDAVKLIRLMQQMIGEEGTLLMPTFPFSGKQVRYVEKTNRFDVKRTPSQVGLITEVFRRMPDVVRSYHPTHSVAGWGKHAGELLGAHHLGGAFGEHSPLYKLRRCGGLVVGLGTGLRDSFTILHVPEEVHPRAAEHFFEDRKRTMTIAADGKEIPYKFRALRADVQRNYDRVENCLIREGILRYESAGGLRCATMSADRFIKRAMELVDQGRYL
jgi:aminoglycoside 3-N-acetyltransferase